MDKLQVRSNDYFYALTGVRAIAAYMVFAHHFIPFSETISGIKFGCVSGELHIGVAFFFVLSGFLIHNRYSHVFAGGNTKEFFSYFFARIARIVPLFFILNFLTFLVLFFVEKNSITHLAGQFVLNITFLKGFFSELKFSGIPQAWSLTVEFCFYAFAPLLFIKVKNPLTYPWVSLLLLLFGFISVNVLSDSGFSGLMGDNGFMLNYTFFGRSFEFLAGCFLSSQLKSWANSNPDSGFWTYSGLFGILLSLVLLCLFREPLNFEALTFQGWVVNTLLLPIPIILFFRGLIFEKTIIYRVLSSRLFLLLGRSSYAFYLIHVGFIQKLIGHFISNSPFINFMIINILAIILYKYLEEPLNLFFRKIRVTKQPARFDS